MGRERDDQVESFISLQEAALILEATDDELKQYIDEHRLTAFQLGDDIVRLRKDQVWELQSQLRISSDLFPVDRAEHHNIPVQTKATFFDHIIDFFYYRDFYLISLGAIAGLIYLIISS